MSCISCSVVAILFLEASIAVWFPSVPDSPNAFASLVEYCPSDCNLARRCFSFVSSPYFSLSFSIPACSFVKKLFLIPASSSLPNIANRNSVLIPIFCAASSRLSMLIAQFSIACPFSSTDLVILAKPFVARSSRKWMEPSISSVRYLDAFL